MSELESAPLLTVCHYRADGRQMATSHYVYVPGYVYREVVLQRSAAA